MNLLQQKRMQVIFLHKTSKDAPSYTESKPTRSGLQGPHDLASTCWSELTCPLFHDVLSFSHLDLPSLSPPDSQSSLSFQSFVLTLPSTRNYCERSYFTASVMLLLKCCFFREALSDHSIENCTSYFIMIFHFCYLCI